MIKKVEGISVFKQKEYIRAEHEAHEILVKNGYLPQGMTKDFKKSYCV
ncbi:hypothetical protein [Clostridium sp. DMHC 10]|nr:hypothetical protein [Clostridium sp. DMHC 10]